MTDKVIYNPNSNIKVPLIRIENIEAQLKEIINETNDNEMKIKLKYIVQELLEMKNIYAKQILDRFPKDVRNMAKELGKNIEYAYSGGDEIIPRYMEGSVLNILMHMVRESVYRIENSGKIDIVVENRNMELKIIITDTGKLLEGKWIKELAIEKGVITEEEAKLLNDQEAVQLIADKRIYENEERTAGRGIGFSNIIDWVRELTGYMTVMSEKDVGNTFTFYFPISKV